MAKFTADVPLNIRLPAPYFEVSGAAGATHRIPDAMVEEFIRDIAPSIPGGVTWITQDEVSGISGFDPATKYDKTGGTISGAVTVTGAIVGQSTLSMVGAATLGSVIANAVTATSVRSKGDPTYNVKAYGAVGDGVTNDAASIQLAINAAATVSGTVYFPPGSYLLAGTTLWITTDGTSAGAQASLNLLGAGTRAVDLKYTGSGTAISSGTATGPGNTTINIENLTLTGDGSTGSARGIHLKRYYNASSIRNVLVRGFAGTGIHLHRCFALTIDASYVCQSAGWGIRWDNQNAGGIYNTRVKSCTLGGVWIGYSDSVTGDFDEVGDSMLGGAIVNVNIQNCSGPGLQMERAKDILVAACFFEGNQVASGDGQIVITGTSLTSSLGNTFLANHIGASGATTGIYMDWASETFLYGNATQSHATAIVATANAAFVLGSHRYQDTVTLIDNSTSTATFFGGKVIPFSYSWSRDNLGASLTDSPVGFTGNTAFTRLDQVGDWEIRQMSARISAATGTGTVQVYPSKGGTSLASSISATFTTAGGANLIKAVFGRAKGDSGDSIGVMVTTSADLSPATLDIIVTLSGVIHIDN